MHVQIAMHVPKMNALNRYFELSQRSGPKPKHVLLAVSSNLIKGESSSRICYFIPGLCTQQLHIRGGKRSSQAQTLSFHHCLILDNAEKRGCPNVRRLKCMLDYEIAATHLIGSLRFPSLVTDIMIFLFIFSSKL